MARATPSKPNRGSRWTARTARRWVWRASATAPPSARSADVFEADEQATIEAVSARLEGETKEPHLNGSLAFAAWVCARLGGWTGYYGKPGPVVMLKGLHQFRAIQHGWSLAQNV